VHVAWTCFPEEVNSRVHIRTVRGVKLGIVIVALVAGLLPSAVAAAPAAQLAAGAVVALRGTPHIWIVGSDGLLHWGGDTRALDGKSINWNAKTEVALEQLRGMRIGDPWLSAGLLKSGDPIYLVKWESDWNAPQLLHIQSITDVELFGISGANYGQMVIDQSTWEARYRFSAGALTRGVLASASGQTTAAAPAKPSGPSLVVPSQAAFNGRGSAISEASGRVIGEIRNDGGAVACGYNIAAALTDANGALVAAGRDTAYWPIHPGVSLPFEIDFSSLPAHRHLEVKATPDVTYCPYLALSTSGVTVREEKQLSSFNGAVLLHRFHALGTVTNTSGRAVKDARVLIGFYDTGGNLADVVEYGQVNVATLNAGQSTVFDVTSDYASSNPRIANVTSATAYAFASPN
jgi:hypothetical protein